MKKLFAHHIGYYISLFAMQILGLALILVFAPHRYTQILIVCMLGFSYVAYAFIHHQMHHSLTKKVVVEYILIAIVGITVSVFLFPI